MASEERHELKQSVIALKQEKSDLLIDLSTLKEDSEQQKSELSDVKKYCESSIAGLKEEVASRTTQGPMVQPATLYVWKSSGDACVSGCHALEQLECPPMTLGVHKWSIFVEEQKQGSHLCLGVASTMHSLKENRSLYSQGGEWGFTCDGLACSDGLVKANDLPKFEKGSKVTFLLDLTGEGTLSASVNCKSFHQLFADMLSKVRSVDPEGGFVPAVTMLYADQKLRFLGFESVSA
jgi:uncharacterized protein YecA (UPF0149 family)